jgi:hypothetical protein
MRRFSIVLAWLGALALLAGCNNTTELKDQTASSENQIVGILAQVNEERPTLVTYRSVMQNLNGYFDSVGDTYRKEIVLTPQQTALIDQILAPLSRLERARRLEDVKSKSFNALSDASHLDACLLFRDAANSLVNDLGDSPPASEAAAVERYNLELAEHIFGWTMRQVATHNQEIFGDLRWPAHDLLRRGSGTPEERLRVFLGLLEQTDLAGCVVSVKKPFQEDNLTVTRSVPVLAGVLIGKSVYLFDPQQGKPFAGPDGKGIATLAQLQQQGGPAQGLLNQANLTAAQIKDATISLFISLPALAPRMRVLQREFDQQNNRVHLFDDAIERLARFQAAGIAAKPWMSDTHPGEPALLLHHFIEQTKGDPLAAHLAALQQKLVPAWGLEIEKQMGVPGTPQSLLYEFDRRFTALRFEPSGGRDLLVRGKAPQAIVKISDYENRLDRALDNFHQEPPDSFVLFRNEIAPAGAKIKGEIVQLVTEMQQQRASAGSPQFRQLELRYAQARSRFEAFWKEQFMRNIVNNLGTQWAIPELREHISYFIALAKMELAIKAERRLRKNPQAPWPTDLPKPADQFASAIEWFNRYQALVIPMNSAVWLDAVKERKSECERRRAELMHMAQNR